MNSMEERENIFLPGSPSIPSLCIVCGEKLEFPLSRVKNEDDLKSRKLQGNLVKILGRMLSVFCDSFRLPPEFCENWTSLDFHGDPENFFPFCSPCLESVAELNSLQVQIQILQGKLRKVVAGISTKIIDSVESQSVDRNGGVESTNNGGNGEGITIKLEESQLTRISTKIREGIYKSKMN